VILRTECIPLFIARSVYQNGESQAIEKAYNSPFKLTFM